MPIVAIELHFPAGTKAKRGTCSGCACTDGRACPDGCFWIDPSHLVCSACLAAALDALRFGSERHEISDLHTREGEVVSLTFPLPVAIHPKTTKARRSRR